MRARRALTEAVSGLPPAFWWLWLSTLVNKVGGFVVPFLALYLTDELGYSVAFVGLVATAFGLGSAGSSVVAGVLTDRIGRRPTLLGAQLSTAVTIAALGLARGAVAVVVLSFLAGFASNASRPATAAMIADLVPGPDRVRAFSLNYWAINLGFAIAPVAAGLMAEHNYLALFLGDAATTLACAVLVFAKVPESRPPAPVPGAEAEPAPGGNLRDVLTDKVFMSFVGVTFAVAVVFMQHVVTLPVAMTDAGMSASGYGAVLAVNGVLIVVLQLPLTRLAQRRRRSRVLALAALLVGVGFGLTGVAGSTSAYALTVVVWTLGEILHAPASMAVVADLSPVASRGRYQGVYSLAWNAAAFLAPAAGGWTYSALGPTVLWSACAGLGVAGAVVHLAIARPRAQRLASLRAAASVPPPRPVTGPDADGVTLETGAA